MIISKQFTLSVTDLGRGLVMTVGGALFGILLPILQQWFTTDTWLLPYINWALVLKTAMSAGFIYLAKNFITPTPKAIVIDTTKVQVVDKATKLVQEVKPQVPPVTEDEIKGN